MSSNDRSSFLLRDFEPASTRLKRKLRLLLNKSIRKDHVASEQVTLTHFVFYLSLLLFLHLDFASTLSFSFSR